MARLVIDVIPADRAVFVLRGIELVALVDRELFDWSVDVEARDFQPGDLAVERRGRRRWCRRGCIRRSRGLGWRFGCFRRWRRILFIIAATASDAEDEEHGAEAEHSERKGSD